MADHTSLSTRNSVLIIIAVVAVVFLPMALMGIPDGYDLMQHMRFAASYEHAILTSEIIPKWGGPDNFGFGSIGVRYYPPLAYIVIALVHIVTGDWYTSFWTTAFAWILAGTLGMFFWIREHASNTAALAAAIVYVLIPFHTFEIYQAVLYSEFAATGLLPFCFLFLTRVCRGRRWSDVAFFAIFYSLLMLTHIPSIMIATAGMMVYALALIEWRRLGDHVLKFAAAGAFAAAATAFHFAKVITELGWVQHNSPRYFASGSYDYRGLLFPIYLTAPYIRYVQKILWNLDAIVIFTVLIFVIGAVAILVMRRRVPADERRMSLAIGITGMLSIFMLSAASMWVWAALTTLQKIQFPWRWLELTSVMAAAIIGIAAPSLLMRNDRLRRVVAYPLLALLLAVVLFDVSQQIIPSSPLSRTQFQQKIDSMNDEEACDCWWPIWARREAFDDRTATAADRAATIAARTDEHLTVAVAPGSSTVLRLPIFYHPYWHADVNGSASEVLPDPNGAVTLNIPADTTTVHLDFTEPPYLAPLRYLALIAWLAAVAFALTLAARLLVSKESARRIAQTQV